jgi:sporulation protein YlmC with PRC-barrel domain
MTSKQLERLKDSSLQLADGEVDIRGASVYDSNGVKVGDVEALFVDEQAREVRFVLVSGGGILGIGDEERLVPVDAIDRTQDGDVFLRESRQRVADAPKYDPSLVDDPGYWEGMYGWYGYAPYWGAAGLTPPAAVHPYRPARR